MKQPESSHRVAFLGSGSIAAAHAYALTVLPYYYADAPRVELAAVASPTPAHRETLAARYGFAEALAPADLWARGDLDTLVILSPNEQHADDLEAAVAAGHFRRIYVEKPLCASAADEERIAVLAGRLPADVTVQMGYQFLQMAALRRAWAIWQRGELGAPLHFQVRYFHGDYLDPAYRAKRARRLAPFPANGALMDLGSHALSLAVAFLGGDSQVVAARQSGDLPDVPAGSDLFTLVMLAQPKSGAHGTVATSRIAAGSGDLLELELWGTQGALRFSTGSPDVLHVYHEGGTWQQLFCGSDYAPASAFPSTHAPAGWLRALVHAYYLLLGGRDELAFVPGLAHGLEVQRLLREAGEGMTA